MTVINYLVNEGISPTTRIFPTTLHSIRGFKQHLRELREEIQATVLHSGQRMSWLHLQSICIRRSRRLDLSK